MKLEWLIHEHPSKKCFKYLEMEYFFTQLELNACVVKVFVLGLLI